VIGIARRMRVVLGLAFQAEPRLSTLAIGLNVLGSVAGPLAALWLRTFVDAAAGDGTGAVAAAVALALTWVVSDVAGYTAMHVTFALHTHMISRVLSELIQIGGRVPTIEFHERADIADRVQLVRRDVKSFAFAMTSLMWAVGIVVRLATTVVVLVSVDLALVALPLLGIPSLFAGAWAQRRRQRVREETIEEERLSEHLFGLGTTPGPGKETRMFDLGDEILGRHRTLRDVLQLRERQAELRGMLATALGWLVYAVGYAGAIIYATLLAVDGRATAGDVLLVISLAGQIQFEFSGAVELIGQFLRNLRAADHLMWLRNYADAALAERRPSIGVPERMDGGVRFEGVSFTYPGTDVAVLRDVDLAIPAGSSLAVVGVNGAGKTTLAKLLAGFYEPTKGRITVGGVDLRDLDLTQWRKRISACFQDFVHFEYLARESVGLGELPRIEDEPWVSDALVRASAADVVGGLPDGLGTMLGRGYDDGVELSVGQWQKVALSRAMMRDRPLVLILDEPTASLDAYTEHAIFERYSGAARRAGAADGAITLLISHRFSTVRMADMIVVLEEGRVVQDGVHDDLVRADGPYRELFELQSRGYR
jgi:ATP-binding cassette, subfamily B, bacterial